MTLSKKVLSMEPSLTLSLTAKAGELKSQGIDIISFGVGEPDFNTPSNIINSAIKAMQEGKTKYTPASGIIELKKAIRDKLQFDNGLKYENENIIISAGAKQCLANVFQAILNPSDEVLIPTPYWVSYPELVKLNEGIPVFVRTKEVNNFKVTYEELKKHITNKTKIIVLNSPNNPTGAIYNEEELLRTAQLAKEHEVYIISDEIYEKLSYDDSKHVSIASLSEDAYKRTIVINGFAKAYAMTGWRVGYAAGDSEVIKLMSNIQSHTTSNVNTIAQYASIEALTGPQEELILMIKEFENRRNIMISLLDKINGVSYIKPEGAFYIMVDIKNIIEKNNFKGSLDFANKLLEKESVVVIPGVAFGEDNYIRLSYATSKKNIEKGLQRLKNFVENLKK